MIDTAPAPALGPPTDVWHERWPYTGQPAHRPSHRTVIAVGVPDEWVGTVFTPLPGTCCTSCGRVVQQSEDCAVSGYCLRCLCAPP